MCNEAIILAGGVGTRLKKVVPDKPKPMALINNKPFLEYLLNYLAKNGITRVVLSVGFKAEIIQNHFGSLYGDLKIKYAVEKEPLGTGGGIKYALKKTSSNHVFIFNGDTLFNIDLKRFSRFHEKNDSELSIALKTVDDAARYGTISIDNSNRIVDFQEKNKNKSKITPAVIPNTVLFHLNTFAPSNIPKGIMLKPARKTLIKNPVPKTSKLPIVKDITPDRNKKINARITFVKGPAREMIPFLFLSTIPWIITAPGAANTKPKKDIKTAR